MKKIKMRKLNIWLYGTEHILILWNGYSLVIFLFLSLSVQECGDPSAVLWLDEIQDAILRANKDSEDALQCKDRIFVCVFTRGALNELLLWMRSSCNIVQKHSS